MNEAGAKVITWTVSVNLKGTSTLTMHTSASVLFGV